MKLSQTLKQREHSQENISHERQKHSAYDYAVSAFAKFLGITVGFVVKRTTAWKGEDKK